eukprot:CAMPEP_0202837070 /NCGR_PEP_ID=MMETSP1389-20130828/44402_1 /ASSEMBLY_ACC=CAM_ASM_000865 /TAXON_ID=302021 /ORGANISM="Rhodomonas sp., Strain CCMP768" /LENGTH=92 /DNA_ID=CAMNT_0049513057 /DNA_START=195 /DNA_END=473 /DNA_ORIENTATION=-
MHRALTEQHNVPRLRLRLVQAPLELVLSVDELARRREVRLVAAPYTHEPAGARGVVDKLDAAREEVVHHTPMRVVVRQVRGVVPARVDCAAV